MKRRVNITCRAVHDEPHGYLVVAEEALDIVFRVSQEVRHRGYGQGEQHHADGKRNPWPHAFYVEIPDVYVVGYKLAEHDREVIAQAAVEEQQHAAHKAACPEYHGRHYLVAFL